MTLTDKQQSLLIKAWATIKILLGTFDLPVDHFPKGKNTVQKDLARKIFIDLDAILHQEDHD